MLSPKWHSSFELQNKKEKDFLTISSFHPQMVHNQYQSRCIGETLITYIPGMVITPSLWGTTPPLFSVVEVFNLCLSIWLVNLVLKDQTSPSSDQRAWFKDRKVIQTRPITAFQSSLRYFLEHLSQRNSILLGLLSMRTVTRALVL